MQIDLYDGRETVLVAVVVVVVVVVLSEQVIFDFHR